LIEISSTPMTRGFGCPARLELLAHIDLVEFLDGFPIEMHQPRNILDRHRAAQAADLHGEAQGEFRVARQKGELFVLHAAGFACDAAHFEIEIDFVIPATKIARPRQRLS
jgi:hypothetical protein